MLCCLDAVSSRSKLKVPTILGLYFVFTTRRVGWWRWVAGDLTRMCATALKPS